ncbi:MAG TPA: hypothetical protein VFM33_08810 [Aquabacterium sp.]|nr:hypothetical protein [Aquabacterium sp.]
MRYFVSIVGLCLILTACGPRGLVRSEFAGGTKDGPKKVIVVPADFVITEVTFGKTEERVVSAERQASETLSRHIMDLGRQEQAFSVVDFNRLSRPQKDTLLQHRALFATMVSQLLLVKEEADDVWQGKLRYFDYTLGRGLRDVADQTGAETAIFIVGKDTVRSTSRKVLDTLSSVLPIGESLSAQPAAVVMAVVDLRTGNILMFDDDTATRKALTDESDVKAMGENVLTDFRNTLKKREELAGKGGK